jgi:hypothetical protein
MEPFAEGHGGVEEAQSCDGRVEVELVPRRATAEAPVHVAFQVRGERAAAWRGGTVDGTGTADLISEGMGKWEANEVEDLRQRDHGTDISEADSWHGSAFGDRQTRSSRPSRTREQRRGTRNAQEQVNVYRSPLKRIKVVVICTLSAHGGRWGESHRR